MDFKSLITKISSLNDEAKTVASPELPKAVQLNEDAELRVLAGTSSYIAEAKKKAEEKKDEEVKEEMKVGDKKPSSTGGTIEKTKTGIKHTAGKNYGGSEEKDEDDDTEHPKDKKAKKAKKESIDPEQFKAKFTKMVEAKKEEKPKAKKDKKMDEAAKPDFLDLDKDGNKEEPMKKAAADKGGDKKEGGKKDMTAKQEKYFGKKNESVSSSKQVVAESVEQKLTFKQMIQLVQESGGQQQIDALDKELFNWANRVAVNKLGEGMKAEIFAGLIYERNGGRFEMYDVLSEDQK
jgi:hypothetical protein